MTLIQYILFANLYLLVFWAAYRLWLHKLSSFGGIRLYLNLAPALSALLPLAQFALGELLATGAPSSISQELPLAGLVYSYQPISTTEVSITQGLEPVRIIEYILFLGAATTFLTYVFFHLRILFLAGSGSTQSTSIKHLHLVKTTRVSIPFIYYNRILIPEHTAEQDIQQVVEHESMHYRNAHYLDNTLFSILHMLYWFNPFFLLLRSALKLNHEFQVDSQMISAGVDPVNYKLSLVRYSVGNRLFSLANGLSNTNTYKRIEMIDKKVLRKSPWRFILPIPILILLFSAFTFACIQPTVDEEPLQIISDAFEASELEDSLKLKFIDSYAAYKGTEVKWYKNSVITVLMNRNSLVMIEREVIDLQDVEQKIISEYSKKLEDKEVTSEIKVYVSKDIKTDNEKYQSMLEEISLALLKIRDMQSIKLYGKIFESLEDTEKLEIEKQVPYQIYGAAPMAFTNYDTQPKFRGEGQKAFVDYVTENLECPEAYIGDSVVGRTVFRFVVNADGSIGDVDISASAYPLVDQEILRVIKSSSTWTPAMKKGEPVPCTLEYGFSFSFQ